MACAAAFFVAAACSGGSGGAATDGAQVDATAVDAPVGVVDVTRLMPECQALPQTCGPGAGASCGACQYRIRFDAARCSPARPCADLFLLWAFAGCEGAQVQQTLDQIRVGHPDYVTACVQPLYPGELLPSSIGAPERDVAVMSALTAALRTGADTGAWTGERLLMAGCSAGASRYPVVAARYPDDAQWLGTRTTAACFSDGVIDVAYQDRFVGEAAGGASCAMRHDRIARGYTVTSPTAGHACAGSPGGQCACDPAHASRSFPGDCGDGDCVAFDSIVGDGPGGLALAPGVVPGDFAVRSWKLVGEGDSFRATAQRCERDVVGEAPMAALCTALDADPDRTCTFLSLPDSQHCGTFMRDLGTICVDWFETLP